MAMDQARTYLYKKITEQGNNDVNRTGMCMKAAFVAYHTCVIELRNSLNLVGLASTGTKYRMAERRMTAQPFCTDKQLDFIMLMWIKDRKVKVTLDDLTSVSNAAAWISKHREQPT